MTEHTKNCEGYCPKCGSTNIEWDSKDYSDAGVSQDGLCCDCECSFTEYSCYKETLWEE